MKGDPNLGRVFTRKCCSRGCSGGVGSGSDGWEEVTGVGEEGKSSGGAAGFVWLRGCRAGRGVRPRGCCRPAAQAQPCWARAAKGEPAGPRGALDGGRLQAAARWMPGSARPAALCWWDGVQVCADGCMPGLCGFVGCSSFF